MKVFISWSGERSKAVARAMYDWTPNVVQTVKPWMSEQLAKGVRWNAEIAAELSESQFGIICLTPENMTAPWLLFETGALSKTLVNTFVCPYLYDLRPNNLEGPLTQFQSAKADRDDTLGLVKSINQAQGENVLTDAKLESTFYKWWPDLEKELAAIPPVKESVPKKRSVDSMIEEILETVRRLDRGDAIASKVRILAEELRKEPSLRDRLIGECFSRPTTEAAAATFQNILQEIYDRQFQNLTHLKDKTKKDTD